MDSTSRTLFYRSFNRTISLLKSLENLHHRKVLDYKKLQSVSHQTYWNLDNFYDGANAFFTPVRDEFYLRRGKRFFESFKNSGYKTGYFWDLCFHEKWTGGNAKNRKRKLMVKTFFRVTGKEMGLDDIGIVESICEIAKQGVSISTRLEIFHHFFLRMKSNRLYEQIKKCISRLHFSWVIYLLFL